MLAFVLVATLLLLVPQRAQSQVTSSASIHQEARRLCPASPELYGNSEAPTWFEGTFGTRTVKLYLDRVGNGAVGTFYSTDDWQVVDIGGKWSAENSLTLGIVNDNEAGSPTRYGLKGQIVGKKFLGTWKQDPSSPAVPARLYAVVQPQCDGRGPWRSFSDKRWPIEFSYPANWHVAVSETALTLTCPDPFWMAYDGVNLTMTKSTRQDIALTQCGVRWIFESDDCDLKEPSGFTSEAIVQTSNGITRYTNWHYEHRLYCKGGGYIGEGRGDAEVLQVGDIWITVQAEQETAKILPRLNKSLKLRP